MQTNLVFFFCILLLKSLFVRAHRAIVTLFWDPREPQAHLGTETSFLVSSLCDLVFEVACAFIIINFIFHYRRINEFAVLILRSTLSSHCQTPFTSDSHKNAMGFECLPLHSNVGPGRFLANHPLTIILG